MNRIFIINDSNDLIVNYDYLEILFVDELYIYFIIIMNFLFCNINIYIYTYCISKFLAFLTDNHPYLKIDVSYIIFRIKT